MNAPATVAAYASIRLLVWVAPRPKGVPKQIDAHPHQAAGLVIAWFGKAYQASFLRDSLKRSGNACVYLPTCTDYAERAVLKYGVVRGLMLTGDRFRRCTEGGSGSYVDFP